MNCSDLERYLEAYVDGSLGKGRLSLLKRHVAGCPRCRQRIGALSGFERDLQQRFRSINPAEAVWAPLEMELVEQSGARPAPQQDKSSHRLLLPRPDKPLANPRAAPRPAGARTRPAPAGGGRRGGYRAVFGVGLSVAVLAVFFSSTGGWFGGGQSRQILSDYRGLTDDPEGLQAPATGLTDWFSAQAGFDAPEALGPGGVLADGLAEASLLGAKVDDEAGGALLLYEVKGQPTMVMVSPTEGRDERPIAERLDGELNHVRWAEDGYRYAAVGPLGLDELMLLSN